MYVCELELAHFLTKCLFFFYLKWKGRYYFCYILQGQQPNKR